MQIQNKVCVITGAGKGLGHALAQAMHQRGAKLVLADIDAEQLAAACKTFDARGVVCDVTKQEDVARLAKEAEVVGPIEAWINNAGRWLPYMPVEELDFAKAHALMDVNYFGLAYGVVEAMKRMRARGSGMILNIVSVRGLEGKALAAAYSASKFAAEGFTQAVRGELAGSGVHVVSVYPYRMKTELFGDSKHDDYHTSMEPEDVARIIVENICQDSPEHHVEIWSVSDVRKKSY